MTISLTSILLIVLTAIASWLVTPRLLKLGNKVEDKRRDAAVLALKLQEYGLVYVPEFLIDYSVGDLSGMAEKIIFLVRLLETGDTAVILEFDKVFEKVLTEKLKTESGRILMAARLADVAAVTDSLVVQNAPSVSLK